jgi:hypothetical protein
MQTRGRNEGHPAHHGKERKRMKEANKKKERERERENV